MSTYGFHLTAEGTFDEQVDEMATVLKRLNSMSGSGEQLSLTTLALDKLGGDGIHLWIESEPF